MKKTAVVRADVPVTAVFCTNIFFLHHIRLETLFDTRFFHKTLQFPLLIIQAGPCVIITKTVVRKPAVDIAPHFSMI